jgi:hypothetical protein
MKFIKIMVPGVGWGHKRGNCFYMSLYREHVLIPSHKLWKRYSTTEWVCYCVCHSFGGTVALSVHPFLLMRVSRLAANRNIYEVNKYVFERLQFTSLVWTRRGGVSSYILVCTQTYHWNGYPFLTSQIYMYQWDAIFLNLLYQWIDNLVCHYINGGEYIIGIHPL